MVSLEPKGDVFSEHIWPAQPSCRQLLDRCDPGLLYLGVLLAQFGNSLYIAAMTTLLVLAIGSMTSFSVGRMRVRNGWLVTNAALLTYVIPRRSWRFHSI